MTEVTMRGAVPADARGLCELVASEEELFFFYPKGRYPLTVEQVLDLLRRRRKPTVMEVAGDVAGFGAFYGLKKERYVYIGNVAVGPPWRGQGLARQLVLHLIDLAFREYDLPQVRISVFGRNAAALLLYSSLGFKPYAVRDRRDPRGERVALLHLRLKRAAATPAP